MPEALPIRPPAPSVLLVPFVFPPFPSERTYREAILLSIVVVASSLPIRPPALLPDHTWSFDPEPETAVSETFTVAALPVLPIRPPAYPLCAVIRMPYAFPVPVVCPASPQSVPALSVKMVRPLMRVSPPFTAPIAPPAAPAPVTSRVWADTAI